MLHHLIVNLICSECPQRRGQVRLEGRVGVRRGEGQDAVPSIRERLRSRQDVLQRATWCVYLVLPLTSRLALLTGWTEKQTVAFNLKAREDFKKNKRARMSVWEAIELLNTLIDDSDPDVRSSLKAYLNSSCAYACYPTLPDQRLPNRALAADRWGNSPRWKAWVDAGHWSCTRPWQAPALLRLGGPVGCCWCESSYTLVKTIRGPHYKHVLTGHLCCWLCVLWKDHIPGYLREQPGLPRSCLFNKVRHLPA